MADPYYIGSGKPSDHVISAAGTLASFGRAPVTVAPEATLASGGGDGVNFFVPLAGNALSTTVFPAGTFDMRAERGATLILYARFAPAAADADIFVLEDTSSDMTVTMRLTDGGATLQCRMDVPSMNTAPVAAVATRAAADDDFHSFVCLIDLAIINLGGIVTSEVKAWVDGGGMVSGRAGGRPDPANTPTLVRLGDGGAAAADVSVAMIYDRKLDDINIPTVHNYLATITSTPVATLFARDRR